MHRWLRKLNESSMVTVFAALSGSCAQHEDHHRPHGMLTSAFYARQIRCRSRSHALRTLLSRYCKISSSTSACVWKRFLFRMIFTATTVPVAWS